MTRRFRLRQLRTLRRVVALGACCGVVGAILVPVAPQAHVGTAFEHSTDSQHARAVAATTGGSDARQAETAAPHHHGSDSEAGSTGSTGHDDHGSHAAGPFSAVTTLGTETEPCDHCGGMPCDWMASCSSVVPGPTFGAWTLRIDPQVMRTQPLRVGSLATWVTSPPLRPPKTTRHS